MMTLRDAIGSFLERRSMRTHRSRIGWRVAPTYTRYLARCRREAPAQAHPGPEVAAAAARFAHDGFASFHTPRTGAVAAAISREIERREAAGEVLWQPPTGYGNQPYAGDPWKDFPHLEELFSGDLGDFLTAHYGTGFKILYGSLYRSEREGDARVGSQMWHSDSGPGTCINVMFYLHPTTPEDGPLEVLGWESSLALYEREKKLLRAGALQGYGETARDRISNWYAERIASGDGGPTAQPHGPAGLVVPFLNNTLHRGGFPAAGRTRTAIVFHCYPSHRPTDLARYRTAGIRKSVPYPRDPAAEF